ncbi:protein of unknown function [Algoriphagus locisalis]|uniref:DUF4153 domain-containing protein n=1 Tax=Algoriphagus locisalis TaxID=305507 RepID=A0A1I6XI97_9BACT|nr:DUF4153 domain-containing protein [Algoriphagus locisalis]SFT37856.1 protein of unknown function [Algoriphagus locisalis]
MHQEIKNHINDPAFLEKLYRKNKSEFKTAFIAVYPEIMDNIPAKIWHERLTYESNSISWGSKNDFLFVAVSAFLAGMIARIPFTFSISEDFFYPRNIAFIVFPFLTAFFVWKNKVAPKTIAIISAVTVACLIYINSLPEKETDVLILACLHLPVLLWILIGVAFSGNQPKNLSKRLDFLRFNGDLIVMSALLGIAAGILSGITFGLFALIDINIGKFFQENLVVFGLPAIPILATLLTQTNPQLVNKVSPIIAKIFSPAVLIMLVVYLGAIIFSGKNPYTDRDFLLLFNSLLVGVMALIFFSVAESAEKEKNSADFWILFFLSIVTIIVNGVALSAILFRIAEWGFTPNRMAVLGSNLLMLIHLLLIAAKLFKTVTRENEGIEVGKTIVRYMPVYFIWAAFVLFIFPLIFGFK